MTAATVLPQHHNWLARLSTIQLGLAARGAPGLGLGGARATAEADWWRAGGVSAAHVVAVYQPKGAASLASSYVNLASPGTYDAAPGVAPTLGVAGWAFSGTQYLESGIVPTANTTGICRFSNASGAGSRAVFGVNIHTLNQRFYIRVRDGVNRRWTYGTGNLLIAGVLTSGVIALAGENAYLNGASEGAVSGSWVDTSDAMTIGVTRTPGATLASYYIGNIEALAFYDTKLTAPQVAAISAAMAAL
jgi:hypothetical protein